MSPMATSTGPIHSAVPVRPLLARTTAADRCKATTVEPSQGGPWCAVGQVPGDLPQTQRSQHDDHERPRGGQDAAQGAPDRAPEFEACLDAVVALDPVPAERLVVISGADEAAIIAARRRGLDVIATATATGPAEARNLGAARTSAAVIVFIDSDVVVPPDAVRRIAALLAASPETAAVFGSYDDRAGAEGLLARYKNLLHQWTHQQAARTASTFWTGFGAIRRAPFVAVGGGVPAAVVAGLSLLGLGLCNRRFVRVLATAGGVRLAAAGAVLHWLSLGAGGAAFAIGTIRWWLRRRQVAPA